MVKCGAEIVLEQNFIVSAKAADWTKDGLLIVDSNKYKRSVKDKTAQLIISNAEVEDSGVYSVSVGRRSKQMVVEVEPKVSQQEVQPEEVEVSSEEDDSMDENEGVDMEVIRMLMSGQKPGKGKEAQKPQTKKVESIAADDENEVEVDEPAVDMNLPKDLMDGKRILKKKEVPTQADQPCIISDEVTQVVTVSSLEAAPVKSDETPLEMDISQKETVASESVAPHIDSLPTAKAVEEPSNVLFAINSSNPQVGQTLALKCNFSKAAKGARWYKDGKILPKDPRILTSHDGNSAMLQIENISPTDNGNYGVGLGMIKTYMDVLVSEKSESTEDKAQESIVDDGKVIDESSMASNEAPNNVECHPLKDETKELKQEKQARDSPTISNNEAANQVIPPCPMCEDCSDVMEANLVDLNQAVTEATNEATTKTVDSQASVVSEVTVDKDKQKIKEVPLQEAKPIQDSDIVTVVPEAISEAVESLFSLTQGPFVNGQNVTLKCNFTKPATGARWYKDGKILVGDTRIVKSVDNNSALLLINQIDKTDAGKYGVGLGMVKSYLIIDVVEKEVHVADSAVETPVSSITQNAEMISQDAVIVPEKIAETSPKEKDVEATTDVSESQSPIPELSGETQKGLAIPPCPMCDDCSDAIQETLISDQTVIDKTEDKDSKAGSGAQEQQIATVQQAIDAPAVSQTTEETQKKETETIKEPDGKVPGRSQEPAGPVEPIDTLFSLSEPPYTIGSSISLKCNFIKPAKGARWYKDGKIILSNPRFLKSVEENSALLRILNIESSDAGKYAVGLGTVKSYFTIEVVEKSKEKKEEPKTDEEIQTKELSKKIEKDEDESKILTLEQAETEPAKSLDPDTSLEGKLEAKVAADTSVKDKALLEGEEPVDSQSSILKQEDVDVVATETTLKKDQKELEEQVPVKICAIEENKGTDEMTLSKDLQHSPIEAEVTDTLFSLSNDPAIVGQTVNLKCNFLKPAKGARWYKDGKMILNEKRISKTSEENSAMLAIQNVEKKDGGKYAVALGTIKSYFTLNVIDEIRIDEVPATKKEDQKLNEADEKASGTAVQKMEDKSLKQADASKKEENKREEMADLKRQDAKIQEAKAKDAETTKEEKNKERDSKTSAISQVEETLSQVKGDIGKKQEIKVADKPVTKAIDAKIQGTVDGKTTTEEQEKASKPEEGEGKITTLPEDKMGERTKGQENKSKGSEAAVSPVEEKLPQRQEELGKKVEEKIEEQAVTTAKHTEIQGAIDEQKATETQKKISESKEGEGKTVSAKMTEDKMGNIKVQTKTAEEKGKDSEVPATSSGKDKLVKSKEKEKETTEDKVKDKAVKKVTKAETKDEEKTDAKIQNKETQETDLDKGATKMQSKISKPKEVVEKPESSEMSEDKKGDLKSATEAQTAKREETKVKSSETPAVPSKEKELPQGKKEVPTLPSEQEKSPETKPETTIDPMAGLVAPLKIVTTEPLQEKSTLVMECTFTNPCQTAKWTKNGKLLTTGPRVQKEVNGNIARVKMKDLTMKDSGEYTVTLGDFKSTLVVDIAGIIGLLVPRLDCLSCIDSFVVSEFISNYIRYSH